MVINKQKKVVEVGTSIRKTLSRAVAEGALGEPMNGPTTYAFCQYLIWLHHLRTCGLTLPHRSLVASLDGYPYSHLGGRGGASFWPQFTNDSLFWEAHPYNMMMVKPCQIKLNTCFPRAIDRASAAFTRVAFEQPECGDCSTYLSASYLRHQI